MDVRDCITRDIERASAHQRIAEVLLGSRAETTYGEDYRYDVRMVDGTTLEFKTDDKAFKSHNIAIEIKGNKGQDSGLSTTLADYWIHLALDTLHEGTSTYAIYQFQPIELQRLISHLEAHTVTACEGSTIALLPMSRIEGYRVGCATVKNGRMISISIDTSYYY